MRYEYTRTDFTPDYEQAVRVLTNPNGRGNAAYDMDAERAMKPQDRLVSARYWFHGVTGFSAEFRWQSGRQDAYVVPDVPKASRKAIRERKAFLETLKRKHQEEQDGKAHHRAA